jgi:transcriptional regulator with XRE-family HTH domain
VSQNGRRLRLRESREEREWTQQDVAEQLARLAWLRWHKRVGATADMVAKWERGEKRPSPPYRELLCLLFGKSADYLGIGPAKPGQAAKGQDETSTVDASLFVTLDGAAAVLDQLGTAGTILQPKMFDVWKDELMQRRALLKLMGLTPAAAALPFAADAETRSRAGTPTPGTCRIWSTLPTSSRPSTTPPRRQP